MKYGNDRRTGFASKLESALYHYLLLFEKKGEITELRCQPHVHLTDAKVLMIPDFSAIKDGILTYYEAKGFETDVWRIKRRLWKHYGPGPLEVYKGSYIKFYLHEVICPRNQE